MQVHSLSANIGNDDCDPQAFFIGLKMKSRRKVKLVHGIGINDADYCVVRHEKVEGKKIQVWACPFYRKWRDMLARCYSPKVQSRHPTYSGCSVAEEWLIFSSFRRWMSGLDWYGLDLDKDILEPGNKIYSSERCLFISRDLNRFITDSHATRGDWPIGVYWDWRISRFQAGCRNPFTDKQDSLGTHECPLLAHEEWRKAKHRHACAYADIQTDQRIAEALRTRYLPGTEHK